MPFLTTEILYCITPAEYVETVLQEGLKPRNDYFVDFKAIVLAYSKDPVYQKVHEFSVAGFHRQGMQMVRLHICTMNNLYRSLFPNRTYQVISLDPIQPSEVVKLEKL